MSTPAFKRSLKAHILNATQIINEERRAVAWERVLMFVLAGVLVGLIVDLVAR